MRIKNKKRFIIFCGVAVLVVLVTIGTVGALNGWFGKSGAGFSSSLLPEWKYRRPITISGSTSNQTDYQVLITADTASLVSAGKMQSDCDDIRFTDADDLNTLNYWLESDCDTASTKIWVKVPSISTDGATIYMYYGNSLASSGSNGDNTFPFFDDFPGSSLNTGKWTVTGTDYSVSGGQLSLGVTGGSTAVYSIPTFGQGYAFRGRSKVPSGSNYYGYMLRWRTSGVNNPQFGWVVGYDWPSQYYDKLYAWYYDGANHQLEITGITWTSYNIYEIRRPLSVDATWWANEVQKWTYDTDTVTAAISVGAGKSGPDLHIVSDWYLVRKCVSSEPTGTVGDEETNVTPVGHWRFDEGSGSTAYDSTLYNNDGTITGASWVTGKYGSALSFDGNDYVTVPHSSSLNITDAVTVEAWAYDPPLENKSQNANNPTYSASNYGLAYQLSIPEIPGDLTELNSYGGENWFVVSSEGKDVSVDVDGVTFDDQGNLHIDPTDPALGWRNEGQITIDKSAYVIYEGANETRIKYSDYVYGTGRDLYQLEDAPQTDKDSTHLHGIPRIRIYASVEGKVRTLIKTYGQIFNGQWEEKEGLIFTEYSVNPATGKEWTWQEIDDLQAGIELNNGKCYFIYIEAECLISSQTFFPITPIELTPGTANAWTDVDVSAYVSSGATGVILHLVTSVSAYSVGLRKNGSTDNRTMAPWFPHHMWAAIGIDGGRIFEAYIGDITNVDVWLVGYTMSGVTFFTNAYDKSLTGTGAWADINCATEAPNAIGLIFEVQETTGTNYNFGLRKNGSGDNRIGYFSRHNTFGAIIGCDASQICEGYIGSTNQDFFLVGYITDGATFNLNATDLSLSGTGAWADLTALPSGAVMGFIEVNIITGYPPPSYNYGLRKNGSAEDIYTYDAMHPWAFVECDAGGIIEGKIENTAVDFFLVGYAYGPATSTIVGKGEDAYQLEIDSNLNVSGYINSQAVTYQITKAWHHLALTYDKSYIKLYIDGILENSKAYTTAINTNNDNLLIGQGFSGIIDEVRIYNYARAPDEIRLDYNAGFAARFGASPATFKSNLLYQWQYRKPITISGSTSNQTDYQVLITADTASLVTDGKMQSDCDDIRFTDADDLNTLNYWLESGCDTASTKIWVKVPNIPTTGAKIYLYYGNSSASSVSNGENTFILFDDFDSITDWTVDGGSPSVSGGILTVNNGDELHKDYPSSPSGDSFKWVFRHKLQTGGTGPSGYHINHLVYEDANNYIAFLYLEGGAYPFRELERKNAGDGAWIIDAGSGWTADNSWHVFRFEKDAAGNWEFFEDDSSIGTGSYDWLPAWGDVRFNNDRTENQYVDYVFAAKYIDPEPAATVGSEETNVTPVAHWRFDEGSGSTAYDSTLYNNDGTITDATWTTGKYGQALSFDGNDYVTVPDSSSLDITNAITLTAWAKPDFTWLPGYGYQKPITISNTTSSLADYPVLATIDTASLISAGKMQSDCDDIRFTDQDNQILNYWLERTDIILKSTSGWKRWDATGCAATCDPASTCSPPSGWTSINYDDSGWTSTSTPESSWGCDACTRAYRYTFNLASIPSQAQLRIASDDGARCYLNGNLITSDGTCHGQLFWNYHWTVNTSYFVTGTNVLACQVAENSGGEYFDAQLASDSFTTCNTTSTQIWVKVPSLPSGDKTIYMYYGNPSATKISSGVATFDGFWEWVTSSEGWVVNGIDLGAPNSWFATTIGNLPGCLGADCCSCTSPPGYQTLTLPNFTYKIKFQTRTAGGSDGPFSSGFRFKVKNSAEVWTTLNNECICSNGEWLQKGDYTYSGDIRELRFEQYGAACGSGGRCGYTCWGDHRWIDNLIVRKYVDPEPTVGTPGSEQGPTKEVMSKGSTYQLRMSGALYGQINNQEVSAPVDQGWHHLALTYDKSDIKLYVDGILKNSKAYTSSITTNNDNLIIGQDFNGILDEVRIYNYARTPDEIRLDYNAGFAARFGPSSSCDDDPGACMTNGLVGFWPFDEGSGTTVYDATGNNNSGVLKRESQTETFYSATSDGYIYKSAGEAYTNIHDALTGTPVATGNDIYVIQKKTGSPWFEIDRAFLYFDTSSLGSGCAIDTATLSFYYYGGNNDDGQADLYVVEGVQDDPLAGDDYGDHLNKTTSGGYIAYSSISAGYNGITLNSTGKGWINKTGTTKFCLRLKGDIDASEPTGVNRIHFYSSEKGSGYQPKLEVTYSPPGGPAWTTGKVGGALKFNGVDNFVSVGDVYNGVKSVEFWLKANNLTQKILDLNGTDYIEVSGGTITATGAGWDSPTIYVDGQATSTIDTNWHHVVITTNTGINASAVDFGLVISNYYAGTLDEIRFYNRALSSAEVRYHYNKGGPVAHWSFDEGSGSVLYDKTESNNDGTISGASWATGKYGKALIFDGVNDYVSFSNTNVKSIQSHTISLWVKRQGAGVNWPRLFLNGNVNTSIVLTEDQNPGNGNILYRIVIGGATKDLTSTGAPLADNQWHHLAAVYTGNKMYIYLDGVLKWQKDQTGTIDTATGASGFIGGDTSPSSFNGLIDDVRIYNYARTQEQLLQDYNAGFATYFR